MKKYLIKGNYNPEGVKGLMKEGGSSRKQAVEKLVTGMGGKVESFYYALGDDDVYVIFSVPDDISAVALSMAVNAAGLVSIKTVPLMTVEDMDSATKKSADYRAPGK